MQASPLSRTDRAAPRQPSPARRPRGLPRCALNLPSVIGQTPPCPVANPGPSGIGPQSRRPNSPLPRRYGRKPGIAVFIGRHIFNRSFRSDVNAGVIPFGERTAIKVSSLASKLGRPMDQPDPAHFATRRDFLRRDGRPLRRHCARQPTRDAVPAADRKVSTFRPSVAKPHAVQPTNAMIGLQALRRSHDRCSHASLGQG